MNSPLIVVSNRLPFVLNRKSDGSLERKSSAGGLCTAVGPVVIDCNGIWVGWAGSELKEGEQIPESIPQDNSPTSGLRSSQIEPVVIENHLFDLYYNGCCNSTFWPLFHQLVDRTDFDGKTYEAYKIVNEIFAEKTLEALRRCLKELEMEGQREILPTIWIHDYQLMLAANKIRLVAEEEGLQMKMAFFLHIPFPNFDIMRLFPYDDEILSGILGCDLIGFHIDDYCLNFLDCCERRIGCRVDKSKSLVEFDGRTIVVKSLPIGIPYAQFEQMSLTAPKLLQDQDQKIILGVDRLDYTKGLINRIKAFEKLFEKHPEYLENVTLLQVAVPSRTNVKEYQALKEEIDQLIGNVNGKYSTVSWDGMNLVCKEYISCQKLSDPGVLILSPFAGAGGKMKEALLVNPYDLDDVAEKIHRALQMPFDERALRMKLLQERERKNDLNYWLNTFLQAMISINNNGFQKINPLCVDDFDYYLSEYIDLEDSNKISIILDYDGTLSPVAQKPHLALIPESTRITLQRLLKFHKNEVKICIISGRSLPDLKKMVNLPGVTLAALNGLEIQGSNGTRYLHPVTKESEEKIKDLIEDLEKEVCRDGAWVENKGTHMTWHYREVPTATKRDTFYKKAIKIFSDHGFKPHKHPMALEARPDIKWDMGRASIHILKSEYGENWAERVQVIYVGDNEKAMESLSGIACTFKVSAMPLTRTSANYRLKSPGEVHLMLKWIEKRLKESKSDPPSPKHIFQKYTHTHHKFAPEDLEDELRKIRLTPNINREKTQSILHLRRNSPQSPPLLLRSP